MCGLPRRAGLLDAPVGGGPPASRPRSELLIVAPTDLRPPRGLPARSPSAPRASLGASSRSPARPRRPRGGLQSVGVSVCCLARPRRRPRAPQPGLLVPPAPFTPVGPSRLMLLGAYPDAQLWLPTSNSARNSSMNYSNIAFVSLELQRFWGISKNDRDTLRAKFGWRWCRRRLSKPAPAARGYSRQALRFLPAPFTPAVLGVLVASCVPVYRRCLRGGRLFFGVFERCAVHPIRRHCTRSVGIAPVLIGCIAT